MIYQKKRTIMEKKLKTVIVRGTKFILIKIIFVYMIIYDIIIII